MPILINEKIERVSQKTFYCVDEMIMKATFDIHNEMGRFYSEKIYHDELSYLAKQMGFNVQNAIN